MKKNLTVAALSLLFASVSLSGFAQSSILPIDSITKLITYKEVVQQEADVNKLYVTAIAWINANYKNPNEATTVRDPENGKIVIRHRFKIYNFDVKTGDKSDAGAIIYTLKLEFKPNKYRYIFTDFSLEATSKFPLERWLNKKDPQYTPACEEYIKQVNTWVTDMIVSLKKGMVPKVETPDTW
ncbi:MAG: DUF4468 domain-containing protein [Bacteroidota bacterium]